ncbi:MAG: DUF6516 family protein [Rhodanobacter sp.]|jgi:hypothetical protein|nr:DUF6516 family protein [Rhodanobacter sp.]
MKAALLQKERIHLGGDRFVDVVIWAVPAPVTPSLHRFKYHLAYVVNETCVVRYDNERGKGDHKHRNGVEMVYAFTTLDKLIDDFWADVAQWSG